MRHEDSWGFDPAMFMGRGPWGRRGHGGRHDWWDMFGGPPPRAERGAVRYLVLDALEKQPRHGYEIMQAIEERSGQAYRPSPGVIYPTLQMLEELRHVRGTEDDGRRIYAITPEGLRDLEEHRAEVEEFYERSGATSWAESAEDLADLMKRAAQLFRVLRRAARRGRLSPGAMRKLRAVLDDVLTKVTSIVED
ncbi:MAG TPA: PadR family transcriptional regulator [Myxococcaceae bacterium]|nr:PadR family transcriptional regulator [Myxococcaceae bacterium]